MPDSYWLFNPLQSFVGVVSSFSRDICLGFSSAVSIKRHSNKQRRKKWRQTRGMFLIYTAEDNDIWVVAIQSNNQLVFLKCVFPVLLEQLVYPERNTREKSLPDVLAKALQHPASICTHIIKPHINFLVHLLYSILDVLHVLHSMYRYEYVHFVHLLDVLHVLHSMYRYEYVHFVHLLSTRQLQVHCLDCSVISNFNFM